MKITDISRNDLSNSMQQYYDFKIQHLDKVVLFQLGDFFEMFFEDALEISNLLELTLTQKAAGLDEKIPMAGVPLSTLDDYLERLINNNKSVVIVKQSDENTKGKLVERNIFKIVTPGTYYSLTNTDNQYSCCVYKSIFYYLTYGDINTGELYFSKFNNINELLNEIINLNVKEIIDINKCLSEFNEQISYYGIFINNTYEVRNNEASNPEVYVKSVLVDYFSFLTQGCIDHLREFRTIDNGSYLYMSNQTQTQLELLKTVKDNDVNGSLFSYLNKTATAMGRRKLRDFICHPLTDLSSIINRQKHLKSFLDDVYSLNETRNLLKTIYDFERLVTKISDNSILPKEIVQLRNSISILPDLKLLLSEIGLMEFAQSIDDMSDLYELLCNSILDDPQNSLKDGGFINDGYNAEIDELRYLKKNSSKWLTDYENKQKELTGIKNLRVKYNKVFGYFIEVTNSFLSLVPEEYIRKQTMTNCERFFTKELKEKENQILNSSDKLIALELKLYKDIKIELQKYISRLYDDAQIISYIDVISTFAYISNRDFLVKPEFNDNQIIEVKDGYHPIVKEKNKNFVNNDLKMKSEDNILLITGPNMAGKSTYMRQNVVIVLMAQMGCYVSASHANVPLFDKVFTRIGASDDLAGGKSTFMVEMSETAQALNEATSQSLLIFDELGRGTSTYDGIALAQSIIEYIDKELKCKTLFSTHYHELTDVENKIQSLRNVHVNAKKINDEIVFYHKVLSGPVEKSYGVEVAKLANLPTNVINRATVVINQLEKSHKKIEIKDQVLLFSDEQKEVAHDEIYDIISEIDVNSLSPIDALLKLNELKEYIENKEKNEE